MKIKRTLPTSIYKLVDRIFNRLIDNKNNCQLQPSCSHGWAEGCTSVPLLVHVHGALQKVGTARCFCKLTVCSAGWLLHYQYMHSMTLLSLSPPPSLFYNVGEMAASGMHGFQPLFALICSHIAAAIPALCEHIISAPWELKGEGSGVSECQCVAVGSWNTIKTWHLP